MTMSPSGLPSLGHIQSLESPSSLLNPHPALNPCSDSISPSLWIRLPLIFRHFVFFFSQRETWNGLSCCASLCLELSAIEFCPHLESVLGPYWNSVSIYLLSLEMRTYVYYRVTTLAVCSTGKSVGPTNDNIRIAWQISQHSKFCSKTSKDGTPSSVVLWVLEVTYLTLTNGDFFIVALFSLLVTSLPICVPPSK